MSNHTIISGDTVIINHTAGPHLVLVAVQTIHSLSVSGLCLKLGITLSHHLDFRCQCTKGLLLSPFIFQPIIEKALSENLDKEICPTEDFRTLVDMWRPYAIQNMKNLLLP